MFRKVIREFELTTTKKGVVIAKVDDIILLKNRDADTYSILSINGNRIYSTWKRKNWIDAHTEIITES